jgi:hypothetical protein
VYTLKGLLLVKVSQIQFIYLTYASIVIDEKAAELLNGQYEIKDDGK